MCFNKSGIIIEFKGNNDVLFQKVDLPNPFKFNYDVIVPPTHCAFSIMDGMLSEEYQMGTVEIKSKKKYRRVQILYISKTARIRSQWGTPINQRIKYVDPKLGYQIDIGCFGSIEIRVGNAKKFYQELVANNVDANGNFDTNQFADRLRFLTVDVIRQSLQGIIGKLDLSYEEFDTHVDQIRQPLEEQLKTMFIERYGVDVCAFIVENINISEENKNKINEALLKQHRRKEEVNDYRADRAFALEKREDQEADFRHNNQFRVQASGDMATLQDIDLAARRKQDEYEREKREHEEDRRWMREDAIMDRQERLYGRESVTRERGLYYDAVKEAGWETNPRDPRDNQRAHSRFCAKCGSGYDPGDKYCPVCGEPTPKNEETVCCPKCKEMVSVRNKFCPICGAEIKPKVEK